MKLELINRRRLITLLIILALAGGLVSFYIYYFRPSKVVNDALVNLSRSEGQRYTASVTVANAAVTQQLFGEQAQINILMDGFFRRQPDQPTALLSNISFTTKTDSVSVQVDGEARLIGQDIYLLIRKSPSIFPYLAALKNQWIQLPRGSSSQGEAAAGQLFSNAARAGSDKIDGERVKLYQINATPDGILRFMDQLAMVMGTRLSSDQIAAYRQGVANVEELPVLLAVNPWSRQLRQLSTSLQLPGYNGVNLTLNFKPLDSADQVNPPDDFLTLKDMADAQNSPLPSVEPAATPETENPTPSPSPEDN